MCDVDCQKHTIIASVWCNIMTHTHIGTLTVRCECAGPQITRYRFLLLVFSYAFQKWVVSRNGFFISHIFHLPIFTQYIRAVSDFNVHIFFLKIKIAFWYAFACLCMCMNCLCSCLLWYRLFRRLNLSTGRLYEWLMNAFLCVWEIECVAYVVVCWTMYSDSLRVAVSGIGFVRSVCSYVYLLPCCIEFTISFLLFIYSSPHVVSSNWGSWTALHFKNVLLPDFYCCCYYIWDSIRCINTLSKCTVVRESANWICLNRRMRMSVIFLSFQMIWV